MPKVKPEHAQRKKLEIVEAAKRVCSRKPVYEVAMRDIVLEAGMSQGGVYKYFANIDEVFVAILNQETLTSSIKERVDAVYESQAEPLEKLDQFLRIIGRHIEASIKTDGSFIYELVSLYSKDPERFETVKYQLNEVSNLQYLQKSFAEFLVVEIENGAFKSTMQKEDLLTLIEVYMTGLLHHPELSFKPSEEVTRKINDQINILSTALQKLLAGE
ncbi:helix-turn-helix domain-containing protein [Alkalihalophilus lindianensis]|uniref:Helix-turn-helix domain-containing protein n=1 Tax=Alkalihalophilus lindianensis TaxID=1630542 RepID=A0ABU3XCJ1_9BACI|nr:helix-turn-helix domain-containing protein [Alkalihalophilus lindianensis]MDV2685558.1 helix-turn-helix domain-containing protein [Alkalihalophilus lindianensis]